MPPKKTYDVVSVMDKSPYGPRYAPGTRTSGLTAKEAARLAVRVMKTRFDREETSDITAAHVVHNGASWMNPLMLCIRGDYRFGTQRRAHAEAVHEREGRIARERRGGVMRTVRCEFGSPAFKRELTKKTKRRGRGRR